MLGRHWLGEARGCARGRLEDTDLIRTMLRDLADRVGLTLVSEPVVQVQPDGLVGMVLLAESHASVHTVPALGEAFVDLFSCAPFDAAVIEAVVREALVPSTLHGRTMTRGRS